MRLSILALLLLASCTNGPPEGAINIEDTQAIMLARAAWTEVGLPDTTECEAPWWLHVSADELERKCGAPSCTVRPHDYCVLACVDVDDGVAYWDRDQEHLEAYVMAHEAYHSFSDCLLGTSDGGHKNTRVWEDALSLVFERLYFPDTALRRGELPRVD